MIDAETMPGLSVNGIVSGMGLFQGNHVPDDESAQGALTNGQVFLQKSAGWWQFYVQAGAYSIPALGTPFIPTERALSDLYGPVPVAYLKLAPAKNTSILIGSLPDNPGRGVYVHVPEHEHQPRPVVEPGERDGWSPRLRQTVKTLLTVR